MWYILKIYYDSSLGTIELSENLLSVTFLITTGVRQDRILSPALFHAYIDRLIYECTNANLKAIVQGVNVSISVWHYITKLGR